MRATLWRAAPPALLLLLFGLLLWGMSDLSPTLDEQNHIARGLAYLRTGDLRLSQEHPPGVNVLEALPLLFDPTIRLPLDSASWANAEWYGFADQMLWRNADRPQAAVFAARAPVLCLTLVLAALTYRWARDLGGLWSGLIALAMLALDPNILAHGRLATTDMGVTCAALAAMHALQRALPRGALRQPGWGRWLVAGIALGAAQMAKFSALVLAPAAALTVMVAWGAAQRSHRRLALGSRTVAHAGVWAARLLLLFGAGALVVWAGYAFTWGPIDVLGGLSGPAPAYWAGIARTLQRTTGGASTYFMGQYGQGGWLAYFPVAFAIKTPLPTLILLLAAGVSVVRRLVAAAARVGHACSATPEDDSCHAESVTYLACLLLPVAAFWAMAVGGSFNIGYRHILPSLPFLYVLVGWQLGRAAFLRRLLPAACLALLAWLLLDTLCIAPHYLAFFNGLAGGPDNGHRYLVDSNLDWGQDLPGLERYVREQGMERIYLSWFGAAHPEAYDLPFHPLPGYWRFRDEPAAYGFNPSRPAPGVYAISVTNLQGVNLADRDTYRWFREQTPVATIGHSIRIYRVVQAPAWMATVVLGAPASQLADPDQALLARATSVRRYDPASGTIYPGMGGPIRFITPQAPADSRVVSAGPGYVVAEAQAAPWPDRALSTRFGGFVALVDTTIAGPAPAPGGALHLTVRWSVEQAPHRAATSFAHLLDGTGRYVAGWDGLTAPATCWQSGDLIVQRYDIAIPADVAPGAFQVEVGWYDADTVQRWPCTVNSASCGDRLLLADVQVGR